jgi:hypothetical protein
LAYTLHPVAAEVNMRAHLLAVPLAALALGVAACESSYFYRPAVNANAQVQGRRAAEYKLPTPASPAGDLRVASFGVAKVNPQGTQPGPVHALHVRLIVSNSSNQPWQIDARQQMVQLQDGRQLSPSFSRSEDGDVPVAVVPPSGKRTLDIFYPLPPDQEKASRIPEFDVLWRVDTGGGRVVAQRTPFERLRLEPYYAGVGWGYPYGRAFGWGPYGWYDPFWGPAYIGVPGWYW